ncbi:MAG: hypothetical protein ACMZ7B_06485 [Balneola sp.]
MRLISVLIISFFSISLNAQVIGDDALQKIQDGEVSFLEGEFIVFLDDTVSTSFIENQFSELGYRISYVDINPLMVSVVNSPADSVLERLKKHPEVFRSFLAPAPVDSSYFIGILQEQGLSGGAFDSAFERLVRSQSNKELFFEFSYSVNVPRLKQIMGTFRSVAYQIHRDYQRSVNVSCEPGKEEELMKKIEELPYVESTALIGIIGG